ncbi:uncharacterized protein [Hyperolius riggenbachi]|uniref:uncharacterized protein isoform X2 n=1 Tax=Hyperolius riggenbachi TaxID=752182 RepID=UPI0035A26CD5
MEKAEKGRPGPNPLPYICIIVLFPVWFFYFNNENTLLYSISVVTVSVLEGALFCEWIHHRFTSFLYLAFGGVLVIALEIGFVHENMQISVLVLVILVPLSTGSVIYILHLNIQTEKSSSSQVIGIFSRSWKDEYDWLMVELSKVGKVLPFYISNSNYRDFQTLVSQCTFAILYHSKTRGRVNVTDVTDSLYDEEVNYLSEALGQEKVLVVVDDLDDSSHGTKNNILQSQPTIRNKTRDLYLFTRDQKQDKQRVTEKLQPILQSLNRGSMVPRPADLAAVLIVSVPWIHFFVYSYDEIVLILSSVSGSLVLYNLLSPSSMASTVLPLTYPIHRQKRAARGTGKLSPQLPIFLIVMMLELLAVYWYHSGLQAVLLVGQSVVITLYDVAKLPSSRLSPQWPIFLIVMVPELLVVYWYHSGLQTVLLVGLSVVITLYGVAKLPSSRLSPQWQIFLIVMMLELLAVYWYHSGLQTVLLVGQSVVITLYDVTMLSSSRLSPQLPIFLIVMMLELLAVYWYYSGLQAVLFVGQSVVITLYDVAKLPSSRAAP